MSNEQVWVRHASVTFRGPTDPVTFDLALVPTRLPPSNIQLPASPGQNGTVLGPRSISVNDCSNLCPIAQGKLSGISCSKLRQAGQGFGWGMIAGQYLPRGENVVSSDFILEAEIDTSRIEQVDLGPTIWRTLVDGRVQEPVLHTNLVNNLFDVAVHKGIVPCMEDVDIGIFNPDIITIQPSQPLLPNK